MADWFKFYENDLDETRLQYAISKLPEVIPVWVGILSEACRHKSGTVSWGSDEIELFGFSRRLGVSIAKINEAINLLTEIRYITRENGSITVIKWGEKQSEYCQKKARVPSVSGHTPDTVVLEERRGEEIRKEEKPYSPNCRVALHWLNEKSGKHFRECESSLGPINARLQEKGVDIEGVKQMIERQCEQWKGTRMEEFLRPQTLFGKEKFDGYYASKDLPVNHQNEHNNSKPIKPVRGSSPVGGF